MQPLPWLHLVVGIHRPGTIGDPADAAFPLIQPIVVFAAEMLRNIETSHFPEALDTGSRALGGKLVGLEFEVSRDAFQQGASLFGSQLTGFQQGARVSQPLLNNKSLSQAVHRRNETCAG